MEEMSNVHEEIQKRDDHVEELKAKLAAKNDEIALKDQEIKSLRERASGGSKIPESKFQLFKRVQSVLRLERVSFAQGGYLTKLRDQYLKNDDEKHEKALRSKLEEVEKQARTVEKDADGKEIVKSGEGVGDIASHQGKGAV